MLCMTARMLAGALAGTLALAACGGSQPQRQTDRAAAARDAALKYAKCMREHGIDMPDPKTSEGGMLVMGGPAGGKGERDVPAPAAMERADKACRHFMEAVKPPKLSSEQEAKMRETALANARCMRAHGINLPDPQFGDDGRVTMKIERSSGIDPRSPKFQQAQKACGGMMRIGPGPEGDQ
jgi:hypothetical protein